MILVGPGTKEPLLEHLQEMGLSHSNLRCLSYNGANLKGKQSGVQQKIQDLSKRAFLSHSLNFVVTDRLLHWLRYFFSVPESSL